MHKNDFFSLYIFFISLVFTQLPRTPNHFPLPRHWTHDRDIGPATATLDPRPRLWTLDRDCGPATRDPRLLVKLTANKMIWQALQKRCSRRGRSRNGIFCECRFFNSPKTLREHMYGGCDTCDMRKFIFLLRTKKSCKLQNLPSRTSTVFLSRWIGALVLFLTATKSATFLKNFQVTYIYTCSRKVRYWKEIYVFTNVS